jgi:hypothetical protein
MSADFNPVVDRSERKPVPLPATYLDEQKGMSIKLQSAAPENRPLDARPLSEPQQAFLDGYRKKDAQ